MSSSSTHCGTSDSISSTCETIAYELVSSRLSRRHEEAFVVALGLVDDERAAAGQEPEREGAAMLPTTKSTTRPAPPLRLRGAASAAGSRRPRSAKAVAPGSVPP